MSRYEDARGIALGQQADVAVGMITELYRDIPGAEVFPELEALQREGFQESWDLEVISVIADCFAVIYRTRIVGAPEQAAETHAAAWAASETTVVEVLHEQETCAVLMTLLRLPEGETPPTGYRLFRKLHPGYYDSVLDLDWVMTLIGAALEAAVITPEGAGDCAHDLVRALEEYGEETLGDRRDAKIARVRTRFGHLPRTPATA